MFSAIALAIDRHRGLLAALLLLTTCLAIYGVSQNTFDDQPRAVFKAEDEEFDRLEQIFEDFGSDENDIVVLVETDRLYSPESLQALLGLVADLKSIDRLDSVIALTEVVGVVLSETVANQAEADRIRKRAERHPLVHQRLVSEDGTASVVILRLSGDLGIDVLDPITRQVKEIAVRHEGVLRNSVSGLPTIRAEIFNSVRVESRFFLAMGAVLSGIIAVLLFRRISLAVIAASASFTACIWALGVLGLVGEKVNVITTVLPVLICVVSFTDSVHLIVDIRGQLLNGTSPRTAARLAVTHLGAACALTSITTAIGFASLGISDVRMIKHFGLTCAMGSLLGFVAVITIIPLLSSSGIVRSFQGLTTSRFEQAFDRAAGRLVHHVLQFRWALTVLAVALTIAFAVVATSIQPDSQLHESMPHGANSTVALETIDEKFGGILNTYVLIEWPDSTSREIAEIAIETAHSLCEDEPTFYAPFSLVTLKKAAPGHLFAMLPPKLLSSCYRPDKNRAVVLNRVRDSGALEHRKAFQRMRDRLSALQTEFPNMKFHLSGSTVVGAENITRMIGDLAWSLGLAAVVIFGVMALVFRSIRIGLICLIPNCLPLLFTATVLVWIGEPLRLTSVIVFSVCLGIAVDDTIHFVTRFQRERNAGKTLDESITATTKAVGIALVTSTLVLLVGFSSVLVSQMPHNRLFAWLSCTAIATALVGDLIFLPAMLACFDKNPDENR